MGRTPSSTIASVSENAFHDWLRDRQRHLPLVGDDLGLTLDRRLLVGSDQVLEGVHFAADTPPEAVGRKAMNRNLSDVAAMAALPAGAIVTAALPKGYGLENAQRLYRGIEEAGAAFACPILGGDTGSWPGPLVLSVAILADPAGIDPLTRGGARVGDGIFVTGKLGNSFASGWHLHFVPRIEEARKLASKWELHAMMDLSDGLAKDLPRLCRASGVGADLLAADIPRHTDLKAALFDGEDYELLFTAPRCEEAIRIGTVTEGPGVRLDGEPMPQGGWEHRL